MKMVQTQQQYTFLYACTYELVKHKIPRAALKLEGRPKSALASTPPLSSTKKVSFPDVDPEQAIAVAVVHGTPNPEMANGDSQVQLPQRFGGLRKSKDLESLREKPERRAGKENDFMSILWHLTCV